MSGGASSVHVTVQKLINLSNKDKKAYFVKISVTSQSGPSKTIAVPNQLVQDHDTRHSFVPWTPDYAVTRCRDCGITFTLITRRHHCRYCGHIFCATCSSQSMLLPVSFGLKDFQRVCNDCSRILSPVQEYLRLAREDPSSTQPVFKVYRTKNSAKAREVVEWNEQLDLGVSEGEALLTITLWTLDRQVGIAEIKLKDLCAKPVRDLFLQDSNGELIIRCAEDLPLLLRISVDASHYIRTANSDDLGRLQSKRANRFPKHLFMITRGTRGDVQPFVALARGLAVRHGWKVTIITELRYKAFVKANSEVERGCICFRPSGGDTQRTVDSKLGTWAIKLESEAMNMIMLSRSEAQFFSSEPALYYWTKKEKPDLLMFGFTMAAVAMTVSEALKVPLLGFILQPTCIPTKRFPPILPLDQEAYERLAEAKGASANKHQTLAHLKEIMENNPLTNMLNTMRKRRGLAAMSRREDSNSAFVNILGSLGYPTNCKTWPELTRKNIPLIIPINETIFGGKPDEWSENTVFTDNIFLRGDTVPELPASLEQFIDKAKANGRKVVVLAFSSMPVGKFEIMNISVKLVKECTTAEVCIVALSRKCDEAVQPSDKARVLENDFDDLVSDGRIILRPGAPFDKLFPKVDAIVSHGGLGTTFEAIISKVPVIITGVMILDQRFWGVRCSELGIGPFPVHINHFPEKCVEIIDKALEEGSEWASAAKDLGARVAKESEGDPSGTMRNADAVVRMAAKATSYVYTPPANPLQKVLKTLSGMKTRTGSTAAPDSDGSNVDFDKDTSTSTNGSNNDAVEGETSDESSQGIEQLD